MFVVLVTQTPKFPWKILYFLGWTYDACSFLVLAWYWSY